MAFFLPIPTIAEYDASGWGMVVSTWKSLKPLEELVKKGYRLIGCDLQEPTRFSFEKI